MTRLTVRGSSLAVCTLCNPTCASARRRNSERTFQTLWVVWAAHICFCTTPTGLFFFHPHVFFSLNYASPLRTLSYQVKLHEKYVKILVLLIIFVFSPSLSPFIAYCYRRNTVYPSSFNPPHINNIAEKRNVFHTKQLLIVKIFPSPVSCKEKSVRRKMFCQILNKHLCENV